MSTDKTEKTVSVPVPEHLLREVYEFLATRMSSEPDEKTSKESTEAPPKDLTPSLSPNPDRLEARATHRLEFWTEERITKAYRDLSPKSMKAIWDTMADRTGEKLYVDDFVEPVKNATGKEKATISTVAGTLGAFSRRISKFFGETVETWPFVCERDFEANRWYYLMPDEVATLVNQLRS